MNNNVCMDSEPFRWLVVSSTSFSTTQVSLVYSAGAQRRWNTIDCLAADRATAQGIVHSPNTAGDGIKLYHKET
jgi:hypothetical protein